MAEKGRPVVVTTEHRGVFFGYLGAAGDRSPESVTLADARMCVYWDRSVRGVLGLAATGPGPACRIGPQVPEITIWKITGIFACTSQAEAAWEVGPWS